MVLASKKKRKQGFARRYAGRPKKYIDSRGYVKILTKRIGRKYQGFAYEHRVVMERYLKRPLLRTEVLHHINEIKVDNRIENLFLTSVSEHLEIHRNSFRKDKNEKM